MYMKMYMLMNMKMYMQMNMKMYMQMYSHVVVPFELNHYFVVCFGQHGHAADVIHF